MYELPKLITPRKMSPFVLKLIAKGHVYDRLNQAQKERLSDEEITKLNALTSIADKPSLEKEDLIILGKSVLEGHPSYGDIDSIEIASPIEPDAEAIVKITRDKEADYDFLNPAPKMLDSAELTDDSLDDLSGGDIVSADTTMELMETMKELYYRGEYNAAKLETLLKLAKETRDIGSFPRVRSFDYNDKTYVMLDQIPIVKDSSGIFQGISLDEFHDALFKAHIKKIPIKTTSVEDIMFGLGKSEVTKTKLFEKYGFVPDGKVGLFLTGTLPKNIASTYKFSKIRELPAELDEELIELKLVGSRGQKVHYSSDALLRAKTLLGEDASLYQTDKGFLVAQVDANPKIRVVIPPIIDDRDDSVELDNILSFKGVKLLSKKGTSRDDLPKTLKKELQEIRRNANTKEIADELELTALELYDAKTPAKDITKKLKNIQLRLTSHRAIHRDIMEDPIKIVKEFYETDRMRKQLEQNAKGADPQRLEQKVLPLLKIFGKNLAIFQENQKRERLGKDPIPGKNVTVDGLFKFFGEYVDIQRDINMLVAERERYHKLKQDYDARRDALKHQFHIHAAKSGDPYKFLEDIQEKITDPVLKNYITESPTFTIEKRYWKDKKWHTKDEPVNIKSMHSILDQRYRKIYKKSKSKEEAVKNLLAYASGKNPSDLILDEVDD